MEMITEDDYAIDIIACFQKDITLFTAIFISLCLSFAAALSEYPEFWGESEVKLVSLIVSSENQDDMRSRTANPNAGKWKLD